MWISVDDKVPDNNEHTFSDEVVGLVAPYGNLEFSSPEFVHFDGEDWYDRDSRTCTVTHWMPLSIKDLK